MKKCMLFSLALVFSACSSTSSLKKEEEKTYPYPQWFHRKLAASEKAQENKAISVEQKNGSN